MSLKKIFVTFLKRIARISAIPFKIKYILFSIDNRFHHILPIGKDFVFEKYLSDVKVKINLLYPVEKAMLFGEYDPIVSRVLNKFLTRASVIIDVGANVGAFTLQLAKIANSGRIIAIEPGPPTYARLLENLELNPDIQKIVSVLQIGISDNAGKLYWAEDQNNRGNAGLLGAEGIEVEVLTLDSIIENEGLKKLDFVKIDVEGMEYEVIKGGINSINKYRPVLYYETLEPFRDIRGFDLYGMIFNMLQKINYRHFYILNYNEFVEVYSMDILLSSDILAVPDEKVIILIK